MKPADPADFAPPLLRIRDKPAPPLAGWVLRLLVLLLVCLFAWAALRPSRELVVPVCTAFALFSAIHLAWHSVHLDGFPATDAVLQTVSLAAVLVASAGAAVVMARRPAPAAS